MKTKIFLLMLVCILFAFGRTYAFDEVNYADSIRYAMQHHGIPVITYYNTTTSASPDLLWMTRIKEQQIITVDTCGVLHCQEIYEKTIESAWGVIGVWVIGLICLFCFGLLSFESLGFIIFGIAIPVITCLASVAFPWIALLIYVVASFGIAFLGLFIGNIYRKRKALKIKIKQSKTIVK